MNGLYATMTVQNPYLDEASQPIRFWANKYKTKFNEDPTVFSVYGYNIIDIFAKAAQKAGTNLTTDSFIKVMDTMTIPPDMFGSAQGSYSPTKRLGSDAYVDFLRQQMEVALPVPSFPQYDQIGRVLQQAVVEVLSGDDTPEEAAERAAGALTR